MLREIINYLRGAEKVRDESIVHCTLKKRLEELNPETTIDVLFELSWKRHGSFQGTPEEVSDFIDSEFARPFNIQYQVYRKGKIEKHHVDLRTDGNGITSPLKTATLYFLEPA